jgi:hypothetical protein
MNIQGFGSVSQLYSTSAPIATKRTPNDDGGTLTSNGSTSVSISSEASIKARIDEIVAKPAAQRSEDDVEFLHNNDKKLAEIFAKGPDKQTAEDVDYVQKTGGFVNTMANLSPAEKKLYDELVAKGDTDAVRGMNLIALSRMGGGEVTLSNGTAFDPVKTEVTAKNVRDLFSQMFVGADGQDQRSFDALAKYLDERSTVEA